MGIVGGRGVTRGWIITGRGNERGRGVARRGFKGGIKRGRVVKGGAAWSGPGGVFFPFT